MNSSEPSGWESVEKQMKGAPVSDPMISVSKGGSELAVLANAYDRLGGPEHIRYLTDGTRVGIIPAEGDDPNSYPNHSNDWRGAQFSFGWAKNHIEGIDKTTSGRAPLHYDDETGVWFFDADEIGEGESR